MTYKEQIRKLLRMPPQTRLREALSSLGIAEEETPEVDLPMFQEDLEQLNTQLKERIENGEKLFHILLSPSLPEHQFFALFLKFDLTYEKDASNFKFLCKETVEGDSLIINLGPAKDAFIDFISVGIYPRSQYIYPPFQEKRNLLIPVSKIEKGFTFSFRSKEDFSIFHEVNDLVTKEKSKLRRLTNEAYLKRNNTILKWAKEDRQ